MLQALPYRVVRNVAMLALALALGACTVMPTDPEPSPELQAALEAREAGDLERAAEAYLAAAGREDPPERDVLRLTAAWLHLERGRPEAARELLGQVEIEADTDAQVQDLHHAVQGGLALADGEDGQALDLVAARLPSESPAQAKLLLVRARALETRGEDLASVEARAALDPLLATALEREANVSALWDALGRVPLATLREIMPPPPDAYGAWVELAFLARAQRFDPPTLQESLRLWEERYPDHPAAGETTQALLERFVEDSPYPARIAVLLPLSGELAAAGRAVRDGLLAAYYSDGPQRPVLMFHDVGADGQDPWAAYQQAARDGAELVVGPLTRPAVQVFAEARDLPVPVLALNGTPEELRPPSGLYRFGLLPEDDARAAARYASRNGMRQVAVLVPDGDWGRRVARAFTEALEADGGTVVARQRYAEDSQDHAFSIRRLFALEDGDTRRQRLRDTLGRSVEFEPRRRQDIDAVFLGAFPDQARIIRPQIRFHHGTALPVLTTSHAHAGNGGDADRDLVGVMFFHTPWALGQAMPEPRRDQIERMLGNSLGGHDQLYGLGADSYRLIPRLTTMRGDSGQRMEGATGVLSISADGQVRRELIPARFRDGGIEVIGSDNSR